MICKVVSQTPKEVITTKEGNQMSKCNIRLKCVGGPFADEFWCSIFGPQADLVFLSGEMIATLPGVFEQNIPWLNDINPATILNMSLYKLVYYSDISFFYFEMGKILLLTIIFLSIATLRLRRQKYASL